MGPVGKPNLEILLQGVEEDFKRICRDCILETGQSLS